MSIVLAQSGEGNIDHPIAFASRKLSTAKKNYTKTEREGLAMVYALQKFRHYLLGSHFKMFTDHSALKYLVNKPVLGGRICKWLILFQEYDFEIIVKPGRLNLGPDHLSRLVHENQIFIFQMDGTAFHVSNSDCIGNPKTVPKGTFH